MCVVKYIYRAGEICLIYHGWLEINVDMWICKQMLFSSIATILIALVGVSATVEKLCKKYMKNASIAKHFEILEKDKLTSTSKISLKFGMLKIFLLLLCKLA